MEEYTFDVTMQVSLLAFNEGDAKEAVEEACRDLGPGADVTKLLVDLASDKS